ncbi:translocation/assembly module TamB domain-containing protein [Pararhizobium sp.]|uniref:translocation/assembly module TamB domain-containing protein n=1 Tax=Pararhizobium sp. TaxID=1977563 RepID=UPI0027235DA6|nr:translocation/assembly module TamB domain-containing protein [Pararhizobium sp.]MDO9418043.1 translocation/assembly module TamB domain-containing protein [Pararhizobium sp.]
MIYLLRFLRTVWRITKYCVLFVLVAAVALILFVGFTAPGARLAAGLVEDLASTPDQMIRIKDPSGLLTGNLTAETISLSDSRGIYAEVSGLSVAWSPLQLLSFEFDAEKVAARAIRIERLPSPSTETEEVRSTFALPVDVKIDTLDLPHVVIGKAIAGQEQAVGLSGRVDATNESIALALTAIQKDRPDAKAVVDLVFNPPGNELKIEAAIDEPKGGVLAKLLRLPNEPAVNITVTGDGPLSNWTGSAAAALDGTPLVKLGGRHSLADNGLHTVSLNGGGSFGALMPPAFRALFEGETGIDLIASFDDSGTTLKVEKGSLQTGALSLTASGTVSQKADNDLTVNLAGRDGPVDFRWPLAEGQIKALINSAALSLKGAANAAQLKLDADLASAELPQGKIDAITLSATGAGFDLASQQGPLDFTLQTGTTRFVSPDIDRLVRGPVTLKGSLALAPDSIRFDPVTIESGSIGGTLAGTYQTTAATVETSFKLFALPAVLPEAIAGKFETTIALSGTANADLANGKTDLTNLQVVSGTLETSGSLSLADGALTAALKGRLPDLSKLLADGEGAADFTADMTGPIDGLTVKAGLTSSGATLAGRTLSDLVVTIDALADPAKPQANLTASGALDGQAINIRTSLLTDKGTISIPSIEAAIGENRLTGALTLTSDFKPTGKLDFNFPDLGLLAAMAGQKASGDLSGSVDIATTNGITSIALKANGTGIRQNGLTISKPVVDLTIADLTALAVKGTFTAERFSSGANRVEGLKLGFTQEGSQTGFDLGGTYDGGPLVAKGTLDTSGGKIDIRFDTLSATPKRIPLKLASPMTVTVTNGTADLQDLVIQAGGGRIAIAGTAGSNLNLKIDLTALPATLVNAFAPTLGAEGAISGTVGVTGTASAPSVTYKLNWANAGVAAARSAGVGAVTIAASGTFANNKVTLDSTISGQGGLSFKGGGTAGITGNMPLSMKFSGNLPFSLLASQLAAQGFTLTGTAAVDLSISGAATAPEITGTVTTSGARLLDVRRNLALNDLSARVSLDGRQATIASLSGALSGGGRVEAGGTIGIAPGSGFPANLTIRLLDATYIDGTLFTANTDGTLTLTGSLIGSPVLGGTLTVKKAAITIPEKLPNSISEINIKHKNAPAKVREMARDVKKDTGGDGTSGGGGIGLDLTVKSTGQIFVRGRGIDAELGGDLTIRGTSAQPVISGGFTLRRGRLEILGKRLDFTSGEIGFGGSLVPTVDFEATGTSGSTAITVNVSGSANNPTVTFASSPSLPQDEVLAQLIFNRSMSNLSALQIAQLASAVSQLAGGSSTSLLDGLRGKLGVDDLDVTTDENGGAQVRAGKYLNDRTYIELQQGSEAGSGKAVINLDVGRGVKLRGEAGSDGSGAAGIFYEKEY